MRRCAGLVSWAFLALACGGRAHRDGNSTSSAGQSGASAGSAGSAADSIGCPVDPALPQPSEGAACPSAGMTCPPYGELSCPLSAVCSTDLKWQITCPAAMIFGPCSCPHPIGARVPTEHRAAAVPVCSHTRAPSPSSPDGTCVTADAGLCPGSLCNRDSQCLSGTNGRCLQLGPIPGYTCDYDTCFRDSDCAQGSVCQCREPLNGVNANYCTNPSNCQVDADCGVNGYCSPSQAHEWCGTLYACHTPDDQCLNDSDCPPDTRCDYDTTAKHWVCDNLCGPVPP